MPSAKGLHVAERVAPTCVCFVFRESRVRRSGAFGGKVMGHARERKLIHRPTYRLRCPSVEGHLFREGHAIRFHVAPSPFLGRANWELDKGTDFDAVVTFAWGALQTAHTIN